jgi:hypothetical protein
LNAYCALWYSEEHACLSISKHLKAFGFFNRKALDLSNPNTNLFEIGGGLLEMQVQLDILLS